MLLEVASIEEIPENALRILEAAVGLFARKGYAATSVREIVQEARVTNPMLYYYFGSKEGLFAFLTRLMHQLFLADLQRLMLEDGPIEDVLRVFVEMNFQSVRESPPALRFVYGILFGAEGSCPDHPLFETHRYAVTSLTQIFARAEARGEFVPAADTEWLAYQLLGLVNSHSMRLVKELEHIPQSEQAQWLRSNTDEEMVRRFVRMFLRGANASET